MRLNQPYIISDPVNERAIWVPKRDWKRLKSRARSTSARAGGLFSLSSAFVAAAITAVFVAVQFYGTKNASSVFKPWFASALWFLIVGGALLGVTFGGMAIWLRSDLVSEFESLEPYWYSDDDDDPADEAPSDDAESAEDNLIEKAPTPPEQIEPAADDTIQTLTPADHEPYGTLPNPYSAGDNVFHTTFGEGEVTAVSAGEVTVRFGTIERTMSSAYATMRKTKP